MVFEIEGFHTCLNKGTSEYIAEHAPFLSSPEDQWLGQGYYFWSETSYWAFRWKSERDTVVTEFKICIPKDKFLDLNSPRWQEWLLKGLKRVTLLLKSDINVSEYIYYLIGLEKRLQNGNIFPFIATRAKDNRCVESVPFLPREKRRSQNPEKIHLIERQQICLYPTYKDNPEASLTFVRFVPCENIG